MKNKKTTLSGIVMVISGLAGLIFGFKNNQLNESVVTASATSVVGGVGLIMAKDNNVTGGTIVNEPNSKKAVKKAATTDVQ